MTMGGSQSLVTRTGSHKRLGCALHSRKNGITSRRDRHNQNKSFFWRSPGFKIWGEIDLGIVGEIRVEIGIDIRVFIEIDIRYTLDIWDEIEVDFIKDK